MTQDDSSGRGHVAQPETASDQAELTSSAEEIPPPAEPVAPAPEPSPARPDRGGLRMALAGAALIVLPGALLAYLIGRPMTIKSELGFPTMIPGQTGYALHPSTAMFYVGLACLLLVGAGAGVLMSSIFRAALPEPLGADGRGPVEWLRRHAWSLALFVIAVLVLFPTLGTAGLWDPWESHYGLVGLRMVEQDDWISTCDMGWNEWFWSKPVLLFWLMGLGLVGLGQNAAADGNPPLVEWAFRLPIALLALATVMAVYLLASRRWSKRAGFIAGLALLTMPQFFFIARQAMTDMPFVAPMTIGLCFLALAFGEPDDRPATSFALLRGRLRFSTHHLLIIAITAVSLPQALLVVTHNKERALAVYKANAPESELRRLEADRTITDDVIIWGSLGQAEDGNDRCEGLDCSRTPGRPDVPQVNWKFRPEPRPAYSFPGPGLAHKFWGTVVLLFWAGAILVVSLRGRGGRGPTQRDVYLYAFYLSSGVAMLAKGLLGVALPGLIVFLYLLTSGEWRELRRLRIFRGAAVFLAAAAPWYAMMLVRHGNGWIQQFIVHDHFKRFATGVHGDRGPVGYFVEQLGIGTFPWVGLIPAALMAVFWLRWKRQDRSRPAEGERVALLALLWGVSMFAFFTVVTQTKFHHYVFPALPGFALCLGLMLDRLIDDRSRMAPVVAVGALAIFSFVARDLTATMGASLRGFERLIRLFMYKYDRAWPDPKKYGSFLDYAAELMVFAAVFGVLLLLLALPGIRPGPAQATPSGRLARGAMEILRTPRRLVLTMFCAGAVVFAGWGLHVYFNQISPHWSEGYLVKKYYELRAGPEERLIAYSLNWHGENSYTANRAKILMTEHGFQREWDDFPEWLKRRKGDTYYFIVGKGGAEGLKSKMNGAIPRSGETVEIVGGDISNKYDLARGRLCAPDECPPRGVGGGREPGS